MKREDLEKVAKQGTIKTVLGKKVPKKIDPPCKTRFCRECAYFDKRVSCKPHSPRCNWTGEPVQGSMKACEDYVDAKIFNKEEMNKPGLAQQAVTPETILKTVKEAENKKCGNCKYFDKEKNNCVLPGEPNGEPVSSDLPGMCAVQDLREEQAFALTEVEDDKFRAAVNQMRSLVFKDKVPIRYHELEKRYHELLEEMILLVEKIPRWKDR